MPTASAGCSGAARSGLILFVGMVALTVGLVAHHPDQPGPGRRPGLLHRRGVPARRRDACSAPTRWCSEVTEAMLSNPANEYSVAFTGLDFLGGGFRNSAATIFVTQKHWDDRPGVYTQQLVGEFFMKTAGIKEGAGHSPSRRRPSSVWATPAASSSTSRTAATAGRSVWPRCWDSFWRAANTDPMLAGVQTLWRANVPQLYVEVDREKAKSLGVPIDHAVQHAGRHAGHVLRERLQQVRPHLAGADVGRAELSQAPRFDRRDLRALATRAR